MRCRYSSKEQSMSIKAMKQAYKAMADIHTPLPLHEAVKLDAAGAALRQAIEQAEQGQDWSLLEATQESLREHMTEIQRLRNLLEQAEHLGDATKMVEQAQPVAWITPGQDLHLVNYEGFQDWTPLYLAPPPRKPLTKENLLYLYNQLPNWGMDMDSLPRNLEKFARAIEADHGIKGEA
jgi:hypothetical protein